VADFEETHSVMAGYPTEPKPMRFFRRLGMENAAWSLRRLHCPVNPNALVLEVGAGGNPYPRANVLIDRYEQGIERIEPFLVKDRPFVLGFAEKLPFKTKSFDFIITSHILEHSPDPESFLREMMRVGKAGYIETPDAFFERINPFMYHRLEVSNIGSKLRLFKKPSWRHDGFIVDEYERQLKTRQFIKFVSSHPWPFYMRFYWKDQIEYEIVNPEVDITWSLPAESYANAHALSNPKISLRLRYSMRRVFRWLFSQDSRNKRIELFSFLQCPTCASDALQKAADQIKCQECQTIYPIQDGIPVMYPLSARTCSLEKTSTVRA
jgi:uncharacterized protein YbaR (Trm112 family)